MKRDFLGISGKDSGGSMKEEDQNNRQDSVLFVVAFVGGSAMQWPFSNKIATIQHLMSFNGVQDENLKKTTFAHLASSGFQPIATRNSSESRKDSTQKFFRLDQQGANQFSMHPYHPQSTNTFATSGHHSVSHSSIPVSMTSPFFKVHGSSNCANLLKQQPFGGFVANDTNVVGSGVGAFVPRNVSKPTPSSQLTIFYAGSVNVYDDVPLEKAQAIMLLASKACNVTPNTSIQKSEAADPTLIAKVSGVNSLSANLTLSQAQTQKPTPKASAVSISSHIGANSKASSSTIDEEAGAKSMGYMVPSFSQHEPSKAVNTSSPLLPRAVPQARKASLARFLEKRKERVTSVIPYSCAKKSPETSSTFEGDNISSKDSSANLSLSSNQEESWCSIQTRDNMDIQEPPSTKLEM